LPNLHPTAFVQAPTLGVAVADHRVPERLDKLLETCLRP
jgi:hypothetical protein